LKRREHRFKNIGKIAFHIRIPNSQHAISFRFEPSRPGRIVSSNVFESVLTPVDFDHQFRALTGKINDVRT